MFNARLSEALASGPHRFGKAAQLCIALFLISSPGCDTKGADTPVTRHTIRLAGLTPDRASIGAEFPENLAAFYRTALPDSDVVILPPGWSDQSIEALYRREADLAVVSADRAYAQYVRNVGDSRAPRDTMRAMALLAPTPVHIAAGPLSGIQSLRDLAGRKVGLVRVSLITARLILTAFGIDSDGVDAEHLSLQESVTQLLGGRLDALLIVAPIDATTPLLRTVLSAGGRLISIDGNHGRQIHREYPFFALTSIPAGTYSQQSRPVHSIAIPGLLVCRGGLNESLAYTLTKLFFEFLFSHSKSIPFFNPRSASATPIPLHEGAQRYYREMELLR